MTKEDVAANVSMFERASSGSPHLSDPEVAARPKRRQFMADYKLRILRLADACNEPGEIGALQRREGLYSSHLAARRVKGCGVRSSLGTAVFVEGGNAPAGVSFPAALLRLAAQSGVALGILAVPWEPGTGARRPTTG